MSLDPQAPVSSLGEDGLVELLRCRFTASAGTLGIGDDAAAFPSPGKQLVVTTDTLVEGVDFSRDYFSGADLGWKTVAVNLSDLAAMGAEPSHAVATLCLPAETPVGFVVDVIDGLGEAADKWGVELVGGDLSRARAISLGLTLIGHTDHPVLRSGAAPSDAVVVSGALGGSAAGLYLLQSEPASVGPFVERHRRPHPRIELACALRGLPVTSMIDVSDGLVVDLGRLMSSSGTGCRIERALVPVEPGLAALEGFDPLQAALTGGEDFELLFTLPADSVSAAAHLGERIGVAVTRIGTVTEGDCFLDDASFEDLEDQGWDHLRTR